MDVSQEKFKRISMCETAKEVWDILEVTHEGVTTVKNSKLQIFTSRFEKLKMIDDETFDECYAQLNGIVNSSFNLSERIPGHRIGRKVMRSLPERFRLKVTAIKKSNDLNSMRIKDWLPSNL